MRQRVGDQSARQCEAAGVPFFFKQWGGVQKGKHGRELDGRTFDEMPARSSAAIPAREERLRAASAFAARAILPET